MADAHARTFSSEQIFIIDVAKTGHVILALKCTWKGRLL